MSLAQIFNSQPIDQNQIAFDAEMIAAKIRAVTSPVKIILFGSAAENNFCFGSDIDLLVEFDSIESLKHGRKLIRSLGLLHPSIPVDLVFVTSETVKLKEDVGGICYIAKRDGILL